MSASQSAAEPRDRDGALSAAETGFGYSFSEELVTLHASSGQAVRSVGGFATQIITQQVEMGRRGLTVCGASRGVGVTFTATNLAVALAQMGVATVLLDANLREPGVPRLITPTDDGPGLSDYLRSGDLEHQDVVRDDVLPNLSVVFAGAPAADAAELLLGDSFRLLVEWCLRDYAFTVIDTPPANRWADARSISKIPGYSLVVARRNLSFVNDVTTLVRELEEDGVAVVGTVMNGA